MVVQHGGRVHSTPGVATVTQHTAGAVADDNNELSVSQLTQGDIIKQLIGE